MVLEKIDDIGESLPYSHFLLHTRKMLLLTLLASLAMGSAYAKQPSSVTVNTTSGRFIGVESNGGKLQTITSSCELFR